MEKKLEISEIYLNDCIKSASTKLVGETMSKFENITNIEELKIVVKNTIYENFRDLKAQMMAFDSGVKFMTPRPSTK